MKVKFTKKELKEINDFAQSVIDEVDHDILYLSKNGYDFRFLIHEAIGIGSFNFVKRWKYNGCVLFESGKFNKRTWNKKMIERYIKWTIESCEDHVKFAEDQVDSGDLKPTKYEWT